MPPFIIGRPGWDNWMIYHCRMNDIDVIDATSSITAVHQNHDYLHVPSGTGHSYDGPEADQNRSLINNDMIYTIESANLYFREGKISHSIKNCITNKFLIFFNKMKARFRKWVD